MSGRIGLGCVTFGREIEADIALRIMDHAFERGVRLFDTAESYGAGASERIIGHWLRTRGVQRQVTIVTKTGAPLSRSHIAGAIEGSRERLGLDTLGVYMPHAPDPATPIEETLDALTQAQQEGKIAVVGCSNYGGSQLRGALDSADAHGFARFRMVQSNYNLVERDIEREVLPLAAHSDIRVITYSPLGAGFLTGKYSPDRTRFPAGSRFDIKPGHADIYFAPGKFETVERLRAKSTTTGIPMAQLAMSWVFQNRQVETVLIGARTIEHLDNAFTALRADLPPEWKAEMDAWLPPGAPSTPNPTSGPAAER